MWYTRIRQRCIHVHVYICTPGIHIIILHCLLPIVYHFPKQYTNGAIVYVCVYVCVCYYTIHASLNNIPTKWLCFCHRLPLQSCCLEYLDDDLHAKLRADGWTKLTLQNAANLCISLGRWDPVALRGMQVLVFLDLLIHKFLEEFESPSYRRSLASAMEYLIKGCYSITK